jgi:hypothetical protein
MRGRKPTFTVRSYSRTALRFGPYLKWPRVSKSEAARLLKISRRTVIRYAKARFISEDRKGRVRLNEIAEVLLDVPAGLSRPSANARTIPGMPDRVRYSNLCPVHKHRKLLREFLYSWASALRD